MIAAVRSWWKHLGYIKPHPKSIARGYWVWGLRPWRGCPFFMLVVDVDDSARQSPKHIAECDECRAGQFTRKAGGSDGQG